jgi:group I intron endonuclease
MFVYLITNTINGKRYIGQTINTLEWRWKHHRKNSSSCLALSGAIKKYGVENFVIETICEPPTIALMNALESYYIRHHNTMVPNGYNLKEGGSAPRHSEETRKKMSASHTGRLHVGYKSGWTPERREAAHIRPPFYLNPNPKLKPEHHKEILDLYSTGKYSQQQLAKHFSVHQTSISRIIRDHS